ncbi:MAG: flagellin [Acetatifactor sp.]|nr:flagellin [Acetatifactor sp.]
MRINYNVSAMIANNSLANNDGLLAKSLERLSSGLKVNHAKDNPSGLAMAKRMNAQIKGIEQATQNSSDGISVIETADGALQEVAEILQRMNELAVKSANGVNSDSDRETIQDEIKQLKEEITRISEVTEFNGQPLLNGEYELKGYTNNEDIKVSYYSVDVPTREYAIDSLTLEEVLDEEGNPTGDLTVAEDGITLGKGFPADAKVEVRDSILTISASDGFEMRLDLANAKAGDYDDLTIDATGIGPMRLQVGANEGQVIEVCIPEMSLKNMNIERLDVSTKEGALEGIDRISDGLAYLSKVRGRLGAYQNRLESTVNNLDVTNENMTAAYSRIMDVDMAEEMTTYTTYQVLTQAGTSVLAQANERPSQVLQLLQ